MYQPRRKRNTGLLWALLVLAAIYDGLLAVRHRLSDSLLFDGSLGVLLGLYICSRGAANLLDLILYGRLLPFQWSSKRARNGWVALNLLILVVGWSVIAAGATQLARVPPQNAIPVWPRR
jgi:hypothetical protein